MTLLANSAAARDIENQVHPQTNLRLHREQGTRIPLELGNPN